MAGNSGKENRVGLLVRGQNSGGSANSGYLGMLVCRDTDGSGGDGYEMLFRIWRLTSDNFAEELYESTDQSSTYPSNQAHSLRLEVSGDILTLKAGANEAAPTTTITTYDISGDATKYTTGKYPGILKGRG